MTDKTWGGKRDPIVVDELLTRKVASLLILDTPPSKIAEQLGISYTAVSKLTKRQDVRDMLKEAGEASLSAAKSIVRRKTAELADLAVAVLKEKLEKDKDLEAVKITLRVLGAMEPEIKDAGGATAITVVMPGSNPEPKTIEVNNE